ncbi:MAG: prolipoprotein diacylglyceryl transferase, partial [Betaproteobacteria bacterium]|nr:prolipoprotein diacylglyceryl transferase [Betaproteobacteria bacterium]
NGELWGRPSDLPWAMVFERADEQSRHPSQLYEFLFEGVLLYLVLRLLLNKAPRPGVLAAAFLIGAAAARFAVEFFREPDAHIGLLWLEMSMGQLLSIPTLLAGVGMLIFLSQRGKLLGFVPAAPGKSRRRSKAR